MEQLVKQAKIASSSSAPAFITGEHGVGKEHIARMLHEAGNRANAPFIEVNCAALPRELIEAELFGSKKGSYTGSVADRKGLFREAGNGTIFLDEIAEMPIEVQSKLLRVLQDKTVRPVGDTASYPLSCRVIAATNRNVEDAIEHHKLRIDLYYRLAVIPLHLPALRERKDDIAALATHFFKQFAQEENKEIAVDNAVLDHLGQMAWEGNVRQLQNAIHRAIIFSQDGKISTADFPHAIAVKTQTSTPMVDRDSFNVDVILKEVVIAVLKKHGGNKKVAAQEMGIGRQTLYNYLEKYGLSDGATPEPESASSI